MSDMTRQEVLDALAVGADLTGANLARANLTRANLYGANLARAHLTGANLTGANLARADLYGADLAGAYGIVSVSGVGSERRTVYAWHGPDGWLVRAGCWAGTTAQLRERVAGRPWDDCTDEQFARWHDQYVAVCDLVDATAEVAA